MASFKISVSTGPSGGRIRKTDYIVHVANPLAKNFSILEGRHEIQVPYVAPGDDYTIVREYLHVHISIDRPLIPGIPVFGDSGNDSPAFTITA